MPEVSLPGCTPEPLMGYLKALGVFRLVAEQADPTATLHWAGGAARLTSQFDRDGLTEFFLNRYRPTPIVGPWGARSGFFPGSSESSAREALTAIENAANSEPRLAPFRDAIAAVKNLLAQLGFSEKVRDDDKLTLMRACRNELPDDQLPWLDAVFVLTEGSRKFPPLLGTGGNEGSGSYTSTFAQLVVELLVYRRQADPALRAALFDDLGAVLGDAAVGHFHPGAVGGPNSGQGFAGGGGVNSWDYLLGLEGALLFAGAAVRRLGVDVGDKASFPFTVNSVAVGYGSAAATEETADGSRAEIWLPLWAEPTTHSELSRLFAEGRAQLGRRQARNAVEFALATCLLGVSRGIVAFTRYGFLKRNGLSFFAAPLGRIPVTPRPAARLLDDPPLTEWLERLRAACRDKERTPARYQTALRQIDRAMFEFANRSEQGSDADRRELVNVLVAIGKAEQTLAGGLAFCKEKYIRPLAGLSPQWLDQADYEGNREFRLAAALAGISESKKSEVGPLRIYLEEVEAKKYVNWSPGSTSAVWSKRPLAANLAAVFRRRQMEAFRGGLVGVPLRSPRPAPLADVLAFLREETGDDRLTALLWALPAVGWSAVEPAPTPAPDGDGIPFEFGVPRLLVEPLSLGENPEPTTPDPDVFHALGSGQTDAVERCVDRAARRLKSGGRLVTGYRNRRQAGRPLAVVSPIPAERLLAAMLFPLSTRDLVRIANAILYPPESEE